MPAPTPEQKQKMLDALEREKPNFSKFSEHDTEKQKVWLAEMELLERRVKEEFQDIELSDGQKIKIHAQLSAAATERIDKLRMEQSSLTRADTDRSKDISYEIVELVTANPLITKKWLQKNPDKFSLDDILSITFGHYEQQSKIMQERFRRVAEAKKFRPEQQG